MFNNITPALMVKNEEFWIHYVLRDLLKMFPYVVMLDTGSTDNTKAIAEDTARSVDSGRLVLFEDDYGDDADRIGNGRNVLRSAVKTYWMMLVDGDEIWTKDKLKKLIAHSIPAGTKVVMTGSHNLEDVGGRLLKRTHDIANKDVLFAPGVVWKRKDYPFESYGLSDEDGFPRKFVHYVDAQEVFCWHVRHTIRSSQNSGAFFRDEKFGYFPYDGEYEDLPDGWLGEITSIENPYIEQQVITDVHERYTPETG